MMSLHQFMKPATFLENTIYGPSVKLSVLIINVTAVVERHSRPQIAQFINLKRERHFHEKQSAQTETERCSSEMHTQKEIKWL